MRFSEMIGHIKSGQYYKNIARAILQKYCPPCHKAREIHDFILATKSSVWIIMIFIGVFCNAFSLRGHIMMEFTGVRGPNEFCRAPSLIYYATENGQPTCHTMR